MIHYIHTPECCFSAKKRDKCTCKVPSLGGRLGYLMRFQTQVDHMTLEEWWPAVDMEPTKEDLVCVQPYLMAHAAKEGLGMHTEVKS